MFDFAWSEIALIGVVALIAIGPKDMPVAIKAVSDMIKKARRMASEFQTHVDEMVKDADLSEVRDQFNNLRTMDIKGRILKAVDGDGGLRSSLNDDPFKGAFGTGSTTGSTAAPMPPASAEPLPIVDAAGAPGTAPQGSEPSIAAPDLASAAPAFIPPAEQLAAVVPPAPPAPPAFIPPNAAQPHA